MTATQNKASWSGPSLAMAVAAACSLMIGSADAQGQNSPVITAAMVLDVSTSQVSGLVAEATDALATLEQTMAQFTPRLCLDDVPDHLIKDQPFGLIAENLRLVEKRLRSIGAPDGMQADFNAVMRAVANARSVASTNDKLIRQHTIVPKIIESDINLDALKALAGHTTRRLGEMVS